MGGYGYGSSVSHQDPHLCPGFGFDMTRRGETLLAMLIDGKEGSPLIFVSKKGVQHDEEGREETLLVASEWLQNLYSVSY